MSKATRSIWFNVILKILIVLAIFTVYKYIFHQNIEKFKDFSLKTTANKYENLKITLNSIKESCGDVCNQRSDGQPFNQYFDLVEKEINCMALFTNPDIDASSEFEFPPTEIPKWLLADYNYGGKVQVFYDYRDDTKRAKIKNGQIKHLQWTKNFTGLLQHEIQTKKLKGPYGHSSVETIETFLKEHIKLAGKNVLVIGSETPWIEVMALMYEAKTVTSVDYRKIECEDPRIQVMTNAEMIGRYISGTLTKFDVIISYSSLEHSGLGRYGDNLNPWGDLISMARAYCVSQPNAMALVGIPAGPKDKIVFNSHRIYGPIMLTNMFANWKLEYTNTDFDKYDGKCDEYSCYQPLFLLRKI